MQLDEYSMIFSKMLYSAFPEFEQYQQIREYSGLNEAYLIIEIPSPSNKDNVLWISTCDEEITVGFDWYHTHFGYSETDEEDFKIALEHIREIVEEKIAIIIIKKNDSWVRSSIIRDTEFPFFNEDETIDVKSWNGTYFN